MADAGAAGRRTSGRATKAPVLPGSEVESEILQRNAQSAERKGIEGLTSFKAGVPTILGLGALDGDMLMPAADDHSGDASKRGKAAGKGAAAKAAASSGGDAGAGAAPSSSGGASASSGASDPSITELVQLARAMGYDISESDAQGLMATVASLPGGVHAFLNQMTGGAMDIPAADGGLMGLGESLGLGLGLGMASIPGLQGMTLADAGLAAANAASQGAGKKRGRGSTGAAGASALDAKKAKGEAVPGAPGGSAGVPGEDGAQVKPKGRGKAAPPSMMAVVGALEPGAMEQTQRFVKAQFVGEVKRYYRTPLPGPGIGMAMGMGDGESAGAGPAGEDMPAHASIAVGAPSFGGLGSSVGAGSTAGGSATSVMTKDGRAVSPSSGVLSTPAGDIDWNIGVVTSPASGGAVVTHKLVMRQTASSNDASGTMATQTGHRVPVKEHCTAGEDGQPAAEPITYDGSGRTSSGYCNYGELYDKLEAFTRTPTERLLAQGTKVYTRLPCALWTDPAKLVGEFYVVTAQLPPFFLNCDRHNASMRTVKWKKSGSPQVRDVGDGAQVMSQFSVGKSVKSNSKAFSCRVSCVLRNGDYQGVFIVQVRDATRDNGGPTSLSSAATAALSSHSADDVSSSVGVSGLGVGSMGGIDLQAISAAISGSAPSGLYAGGSGAGGLGLGSSGLGVSSPLPGGMSPEEYLQQVLAAGLGLPAPGLGIPGLNPEMLSQIGITPSTLASAGLSSLLLPGLDAVGTAAISGSAPASSKAAAPAPAPAAAPEAAPSPSSAASSTPEVSMSDLAQLLSTVDEATLERSIPEYAAALNVPVESLKTLIYQALGKA